ncbi:hypothetical protein BDN70DRAFT_870281 [Pholiota conissans]|uniref:Uncharacterized protein n=1 Tax=Pholiota conissans TaxID=109636 RepID=A0A9P5ZDD9_9AGAR|nr:hypothetical protein BDN70DRAFT_870281 [Pholiota conissans]
MPVISETGDITLSAEVLLALISHDYTPASFRTTQDFKAILSEYIACRDALDSAQVRMDSLKPRPRDANYTGSTYLSNGVKKKLAGYQATIQAVTSDRHPLNDALVEYEDLLQTAVDNLGEQVDSGIPANLSSTCINKGIKTPEKRIQYHLTMLKRTIKQLEKGISQYDNNSNRTLLDKNLHFMEDLLRPNNHSATGSNLKSKIEPPSPPIPPQKLKRARASSPSPEPIIVHSDADSSSNYRPEEDSHDEDTVNGSDGSEYEMPV